MDTWPAHTGPGLITQRAVRIRCRLRAAFTPASCEDTKKPGTINRPGFSFFLTFVETTFEWMAD